MRVLHVIPSLRRTDGGPRAALAAMARGLTALGVEVSVATTHASWEPGYRRADIVELFSDPVALHIFSAWPAPGPIGFSPRMAHWLHRHANEFDLVHLHSMFNWHSLVVPRICRAHDIPFVLRPLGVLDSWSFAQKSWKKRPYYELIERRNLKHAARIHVTSDAEAKSVADLGFGAKVACIPLGIELPARIEHAPAAIPGLRVLFMARLHPKKNLPALLRALAVGSAFAHPPRLTVAGDGPESYIDELRASATDLGLGERVQFVGFADAARKQQLFAESDVFALPSFQENFGVAVAEAMAYGLPVVISTDVALAPDVLAAGAGKVIDPAAAPQFAAALASFEDPAVRLSASTAARHLMETRFSVPAMAQALRAMYLDVLSCHR